MIKLMKFPLEEIILDIFAPDRLQHSLLADFKNSKVLKTSLELVGVFKMSNNITSTEKQELQSRYST